MIQVRSKTDQKGHPKKEPISGRLLFHISFLLGIRFRHGNPSKIESKTQAAKSEGTGEGEILGTGGVQGRGAVDGERLHPSGVALVELCS